MIIIFVNPGDYKTIKKEISLTYINGLYKFIMD